MHIFIAEGGTFNGSVHKLNLDSGQLRMKKLILNERSFGVLLNPGMGMEIQLMAVRRELLVTGSTGKAGFADLQIVLMPIVMNRKDINQIVLGSTSVDLCAHTRSPFTISTYRKLAFSRQSYILQ